MSVRTIVAIASSAQVIAIPLFVSQTSAANVAAALDQSPCQDAAGPSDDPAATPPVVVLRGSSAPPTPWYTPPPSPPTDVDVSSVPYTPPYNGPPYDGLPHDGLSYYYYQPYAHFVRPQRVVPNPVVPDHRPAGAQFYRR
jgi:hypothetical protein